MQTKEIFLAGMPGSGKTAYIGSTWNMIAEGSIPTKLSKKVGSMPEDYNKIDEISKQLLSYSDLKRTKEVESEALKITLCDSQGNDVYVDIPDLAGEIFRDLVKDRRLKKEIVTRLIHADCILFFIYYKNMSDEKRISILDNNREDDDSSNLYNVEISKNREANQSEIVELLQAILEFLEDSSLIVNIRFVLSAWDMVEKEYGSDINPEQFLEMKFPLLYQYIITNCDRMNAEFWGISAIGGNLNDPEDVSRLQKEEFNAIKVIPPKGVRSNDLTALLVGMGENK